jgi:predicted enzyme related to lactoylglutathione lyase
MAETVAPAVNKPVWIEKPVWIDLSSSDPAASREFYAKLFGWVVEVSPDPQYGGYAQAKIGGKDVAGIGPKMMPEAPTAWSVYVGTRDVADLTRRVQAAGGTVVAPPMQVGEQGTMAVFQDPSGAFISAWQPAMMEGGLMTGTPGTFGWAELNSRGLEKALAFYRAAFGWEARAGSLGEGGPPYFEFHAGNERIAGGVEMNPMAPAQVPSYWMVYFAVEDVDASFRKAIEAGAHEMLAPQDFSGGRFAILGDPQGATFGLLKMAAR